MHYHRLAKFNSELNNSLKVLSSDYESLRLRFDKYVMKSESKLRTVLSENIQLHEELASKIKENEILLNTIVELKRKLGMDSTNSSVPPSLTRKFNKPNHNSSDELASVVVPWLNLYSKLGLFVSDQSQIPSLIKKDLSVIELLLSDEDFSVTGCYGLFHNTLIHLFNGNMAHIEIGDIAILLNNSKFRSAANYNRRGGQAGHSGNYLQQFADPTEIKHLLPTECRCGCGDIVISEDYEVRQQINLKIERVVTEFRLCHGICQDCGSIVKATSSLPSNISYHPMVRCYAVYMLDAHFMTYERLSIYFEDVFGLPVSEGSINNWRKDFAQRLGNGYVSQLKELLNSSPYLHADETGLNIAGSNMWAHVVCNKDATLLNISNKRGFEGITASNVLNNYTGTLIADGWAAYKSLPSISGIQSCFAHLFRYFKDVTENYQHKWSEKMGNLLKSALDSNKRLLALGVTRYSDETKTHMINTYNKILDQGELEIKKIKYGKGHPAVCLFKRLRKERDSVLRFLTNINLPLTNNEAERSLRPIKVQQKISGTSLSLENAQENLHIRSFTATCKKQGVNVLTSMYRIFENPLDFELKINTS